jgi:hypothetical protein
VAVDCKLDLVKTALIEILAESKNGMSLAQLPLYLRRKLPFPLDLNELGFPKLKDLILSMSDKIKLELKGHNHPFAFIIKSARYMHSQSNSDDFQSIPQSHNIIRETHPRHSEDVNTGRHLKSALAMNDSFKPILSSIYNILRENPYGVQSNHFLINLSERIGFEFNPKNF